MTDRQDWAVGDAGGSEGATVSRADGRDGDPDGIPSDRPEIEPLTVEPKDTASVAAGDSTPAGDAGGDVGTATPDTDLRVAFWRLVIVFNLALLAAWLGVLFAVFEGRYRDGAGLVGVGILAGAYGYWRYRRVTGAGD